MIFPVKTKTEKDALLQASIISQRCDWFVYVYFHTSGNHIIDITGMVHSDETHIATFYKGNQQ